MSIKKKLYLIPVIFLVGCGVNPVKATKSLEAMGMTDIKIGSYSWLGCSESDVFKSNFTAKGVYGQAVSGQVCAGWFKGVTVRFD